jgi:hypothetical protein
MKKVNPGQTYVGVVEDVQDPNKEGRVKARVLDIFDDVKKEDLPWASPWKDLSGGQFGIPDIGKVVIVVFEQGDPYKPEYICSEHWNINLETKLKSLSETDYASMRSVLFDHKTQIYSNDGEGLKVDYKFNNINIKDNGINLNLKDNNMMLNIGDSTANQQMVLGNNWMNWFDKFVESFLQNLAFIGNAGSPVLVSPAFAKTLAEYQSLRDSKFLSHHVNVVDNNKVSTVKGENREEVAQAGDTWQSTKIENTLTTVSEETSQPVEGDKPEYDETFSEPPTSDPNVSIEEKIPPKTDIPAPPDPTQLESNKDVEKLIWFMKSKGYVIYENNYELNIVAIRSSNKIEGDVTNKFDEILYVFYRNGNSVWNLCEYNITTVPGFKPGTEDLPSDVAMLRLGQYVEQLKMSNFGGDEKHKCLLFESCAIHSNTELDFYDWDSPTKIGPFPISIHRSSETSTAEFVFNYSEGSQVFKNINQYDQFIKLCEDQINNAKKEKFTYTLCSENEYKKYPNPTDQKKLLGNIPTPKPPTQVPPVTSVQSAGKLVNDKIIQTLIDLGFSSEPGKPSLQEWINKGQKFSDVLGKAKGVDLSQARINIEDDISLKIESGEIKETDYIKDGLLNGINVIKERTIENDSEANNLMIDLGLNQKPTKVTEIRFIPFSN